MYFSDDSSYYETTYSQDERIYFDLERDQEEKNARNNLLELNRKQQFEIIYNNKTDNIFKLRGLTFLKFTHSKIKFSYQPSKIVRLVNKNTVFYCSLKYYTRDKYFAISDDSVGAAVLRIYNHLQLWSQDQERYRLEKFHRYCNDDDVYLDSDDEELFLNDGERNKLHKERDKVLQRMLPPIKRTKRRRYF